MGEWVSGWVGGWVGGWEGGWVGGGECACVLTVACNRACI